MTVPVHGLPPLLRRGMVVAAVPPALKTDRWHTVDRVADGGGNGSLVQLSGSHDLGSAEELVGRTLLANVADLPEGFELHDADALLGREVCDELHGTLGTIEEVLMGAANDVWVIDGPYGEVLVPVVDEVVRELPATGPIAVRVPRGIVPEEG